MYGPFGQGLEVHPEPSMQQRAVRVPNIAPPAPRCVTSVSLRRATECTGCRTLGTSLFLASLARTIEMYHVEGSSDLPQKIYKTGCRAINC